MSRDGFNGAALKLVRSGDGGNSDEPPHNGDMDSRVAKLEDFAQDARERLARVETKLDHIDKEVSSFKWWLIGAIITILFTVLGTGIGIQQMTVATFQAAGAQATSQPSQQPPIIINVPPTQVQPAASPPPPSQ
mgnify:CR=1 FL=1